MTANRSPSSAPAPLSDGKIRAVIAAGVPEALYAGKRVLVLTPDATRTCPLPRLVRVVQGLIAPRAARLDYMVALGTHPPLPAAAIDALYALDATARATTFAGSRFLNHRWDRPGTLVEIGRLTADEVESFSGGRLRETVPVVINRAIFDYDLVLILGPVFPHEVVGFSGGAKYLFPGIAGGDFLHFFHWLGAMITCAGVIGTADTPVRAVIHQALEMVPVPVRNISMVVTAEDPLCGLFAGDPIGSWQQAAALSARVHVVYCERPFTTVLGCAPPMYDELWVAGKVMYKLEQVVADGGRLIIYGPHIDRVSRTWGPLIEKVGYHVRDYFLAQMERFKDIPRGVLAHSTHVRGTGTFENSVEKARIDVILSTGIGPETCRRINLGYRDPATIDPRDFDLRQDQGVLLVPKAGEMLYKLRS